MDRDLGLKFAQYSGLFRDVDYEEPEPSPEHENVLLTSQLKEVLDEIFSVDPETGNPRGDIQYFLSNDANPQVKAWLESNLFAVRRGDTGYDSKQFDDDLIAEFGRNDGESIKDYSARLASLRDEAIKNYEELTKKSE